MESQSTKQNACVCVMTEVHYSCLLGMEISEFKTKSLCDKGDTSLAHTQKHLLPFEEVRVHLCFFLTLFTMGKKWNTPGAHQKINRQENCGTRAHQILCNKT